MAHATSKRASVEATRAALARAADPSIRFVVMMISPGWDVRFRSRRSPFRNRSRVPSQTASVDGRDGEDEGSRVRARHTVLGVRRQNRPTDLEVRHASGPVAVGGAIRNSITFGGGAVPGTRRSRAETARVKTPEGPGHPRGSVRSAALTDTPALCWIRRRPSDWPVPGVAPGVRVAPEAACSVPNARSSSCVTCDDYRGEAIGE